MVIDKYFSAGFTGPDVNLRKAIVFHVVRIDDGMVTLDVAEPKAKPYFLVNCSWIKRRPQSLWVVTDGEIWYPAMDINILSAGVTHCYLELCERSQYSWVRLGQRDHRVILKAVNRYCNSLS